MKNFETKLFYDPYSIGFALVLHIDDDFERGECNGYAIQLNFIVWEIDIKWTYG